MARWPVSKVSANIKSQELRAKSRNSLSKVFSRIPFSMAMGEWSPQTRSHVHIFVSPLRAFVHVITTFLLTPLDSDSDCSPRVGFCCGSDRSTLGTEMQSSFVGMFASSCPIISATCVSATNDRSAASCTGGRSSITWVSTWSTPGKHRS